MRSKLKMGLAIRPPARPVTLPNLRQQGLQGWAVHQGQLDSIFLLQRLRQQGLSGLRTLVAFIQGTGQRSLPQ